MALRWLSHRPHPIRKLFSAALAIALVFSVLASDVWFDADSFESSEKTLEQVLADAPPLPVFFITSLPAPELRCPFPARLPVFRIPSIEQVLLLPGHSFSDLSPPLALL